MAKEMPAAPGFRGGFAPVADGVNIPKGTFYSEAEGVSADVPMLICSTFHEWGIARTNPEIEKITADEAKNMLKERAGIRGGFGDKAAEIYDAYAAAFPDKKPIEIMTLASSNRKGVVETATAKAVQKAPVYVAWFGWEPPMFNGRMRAFHCLDICFWYANTDLMLTHTGGGARPRKLSEKMSASLLQFMKTGNPNGGGLPEWPAFTVYNGETMVLNDVSEVKNDPDREARKLL
jgi:para-nitrobenzyl esterase